jgi:hypothetical protein
LTFLANGVGAEAIAADACPDPLEITLESIEEQVVCAVESVVEILSSIDCTLVEAKSAGSCVFCAPDGSSSDFPVGFGPGGRSIFVAYFPDLSNGGYHVIFIPLTPGGCS